MSFGTSQPTTRPSKPCSEAYCREQQGRTCIACIAHYNPRRQALLTEFCRLCRSRTRRRESPSLAPDGTAGGGQRGSPRRENPPASLPRNGAEPGGQGSALRSSQPDTQRPLRNPGGRGAVRADRESRHSMGAAARGAPLPPARRRQTRAPWRDWEGRQAPLRFHQTRELTGRGGASAWVRGWERGRRESSAEPGRAGEVRGRGEEEAGTGRTHRSRS